MICQNIEHFQIGWKNSFFFSQDDLVYLSKINVFFKFYKRQPFSVKGMCQLYLFATNLKRQIVKKHFFLRKEINFPPQMIKIEPGMEAGTAICLYVILFFFKQRNQLCITFILDSD